jgi:hypothetical protein
LKVKNILSKYKTFGFLILGVLALFIGRTILAVHNNPPRLFDLFNTLTILGSIIVLVKWYSILKASDWMLATGLGVVVGVGMWFATLFSPYPFFGVVRDNIGHAFIRGIYTMLATLGGLTIMRRGGPIRFLAVNRRVGGAVRNFLFGFFAGVPLSVLNVAALQFSEGQSIAWQNPMSALLDAFQPAIVEEVIYRFALWGLLWLILQRSIPDKAIWLSGALALFIHNYSHFDELFVQSPLVAIGMGLVLALIWGLPPTWLAKYRGMESAIAFHWMQDVARFIAGF